MGPERCICCGEVIPEGRLVCWTCENGKGKKMTPINLSVWKLPHKKRYYLLHPLKFISDVIYNIKSAISRTKYGFAPCDAWEWNRWWSAVGAQALRYLEENSCGYPGCEPFEDPDSWNNHLINIADRLEECSVKLDFGDKDNEYKDRFHALITSIKGMQITSSEDEDIRIRYFERQKEIDEENRRKTRELFKEIGECFEYYWD